MIQPGFAGLQMGGGTRPCAAITFSPLRTSGLTASSPDSSSIVTIGAETGFAGFGMGRGARPGSAILFSSLPATERLARSRAGMQRKDPRVTTRLGSVVKEGSAGNRAESQSALAMMERILIKTAAD